MQASAASENNMAKRESLSERVVESDESSDTESNDSDIDTEDGSQYQSKLEDGKASNIIEDS